MVTSVHRFRGLEGRRLHKLLYSVLWKLLYSIFSRKNEERRKNEGGYLRQRKKV